MSSVDVVNLWCEDALDWWFDTSVCSMRGYNLGSIRPFAQCEDKNLVQCDITLVRVLRYNLGRKRMMTMIDLVSRVSVLYLVYQQCNEDFVLVVWIKKINFTVVYAVLFFILFLISWRKTLNTIISRWIFWIFSVATKIEPARCFPSWMVSVIFRCSFGWTLKGI